MLTLLRCIVAFVLAAILTDMGWSIYDTVQGFRWKQVETIEQIQRKAANPGRYY